MRSEMSTRITYLIRCSENAFIEASPKEIADFIASGFVPEIRVIEA